MIINRQDALRLIANHELVGAIPGLLPFVERARAAEQSLDKGCRSCKRRAQLAPVGDDLLSYLLTLPVEQVNVLRNRLKDAHLFIYDPASRGRTLVELAPSL